MTCTERYDYEVRLYSVKEIRSLKDTLFKKAHTGRLLTSSTFQTHDSTNHPLRRLAFPALCASIHRLDGLHAISAFFRANPQENVAKQVLPQVLKALGLATTDHV
jgi:hypothetical protein